MISFTLTNYVMIPVSAFAQSDDLYGLKTTAEATNLPKGTVQPAAVIAKIINIVLGLLGILMVIIVIYGGYMWMTSAGSEEKITKAKHLIGNAVVGLMIILASYAISSFIVGNIYKASKGG